MPGHPQGLDLATEPRSSLAEPAWRRWNLVGLTALTAYCTALGWLAQLVVYPLYRVVGEGDFTAYHHAYNEAILWPVIVPGFTCFILATVFPWTRPQGVAPAVVGIVGLAGLTSLVSTVLWAIPMHDRLDDQGRTSATIDSLLMANAVRTAALTAAAVALCWYIGRRLERS